MDPLLKKTTIRFLSFANEEEDADKETKLKEAAATIEKAIARDRALEELVDYEPPALGEDVEDLDPANDMRPLYERLLEQKNKKKEAQEDAQKLSNFVSTLDDDDITHLNQMAKNKQEEEVKRRLEVFEALENKKRLDEQKALDESRARKEALPNMHNIGKESQIKLRLSSMMKIKPKIKQQSKQGTTSSEMEPKTNHNDQDESTSSSQISDDPRPKLRSWLGKVFKIVITDGRIIVGYFVCTDRDANVILENSWEYAQPIGGNEEPRMMGLTLVPGKHIVSMSLMT